MKDLFDCELEIGDFVGFKYNSRYQYITKGKIIGFSKKKVIVEIIPGQTGVYKEKTIRDPKQLIKSWNQGNIDHV